MSNDEVRDDPFITHIQSRIKNCIDDYDMIKKDDKVLCAVSGGKDSSVLLFFLSRFFPGSVQAVTFDPLIPDYSDINITNITKFCDNLSVPLHVISIKDLLGYSLDEIKKKIDTNYKELNYCTICGILKRYYLNRFARENQFDVIATGHNADDAAQSFLMNMMKGHNELSARIGPVSGLIKNNLFVKKVKPLFLVTEHEVKECSKKLGLQVFYGACPYSKDAYRNQIRDLLFDYELKHPGSIHNCVSLFLEFYPFIQDHFRTSQQPEQCTYCGEPCKAEVCSACELISYL